MHGSFFVEELKLVDRWSSYDWQIRLESSDLSPVCFSDTKDVQVFSSDDFAKPPPPFLY